MPSTYTQYHIRKYWKWRRRNETRRSSATEIKKKARLRHSIQFFFSFVTVNERNAFSYWHIKCVCVCVHTKSTRIASVQHTHSVLHHAAAVDSTYLGMHLDDLAQFCFLVHICFYIFFCCQPNASIIINYTHFLYITTTCCIHTLCAYILRGVVPFHSIHIRSVHNVLLLLWLYGTETHSICLLNCKLLPCSRQHCVFCKQSKTITCLIFFHGINISHHHLFVCCGNFKFIPYNYALVVGHNVAWHKFFR